MIGESGIRGSVGIFGAVGISGGVGVGATGGGGGTPLPPIRPNSFLKYTFTQSPSQSIIDRVTGVDQVTTTTAGEINAIQSLNGGVITFAANTQAFDVGVGALIEPVAETQIPTNMTLWDDSEGSTVTYNAATKENRWLFDGGNVPHRFFALSGVTDGLDYIMSMLVAKGESQFIQITGSLGFNTFVVNFDLVNGSLNVQSDQSTLIDYAIKDVGDEFYIYVVAECTATTAASGRFIVAKAESLNSERLDPTSDSGAFTVKYPNFIQASEVSSPISSPFSSGNREASKPVISSSSIINSEAVIYDEYINLETFDKPTLLWAISQSVGDQIIGVVDSGNGLGDTLQLVRVDAGGTTLTPLNVTMTQGISYNDRVLTKAYLKSDLFTLVVENKTTGEAQSASDASIAAVLTNLGIIALGDAGTIASTFSRKIIDFEITQYTNP